MEIAGRTVPTDDEGYLVQPTDWDDAIAEEIARQENLQLTDAQWAVIRFMRTYYEEHQIAPDARHVIRRSLKALGIASFKDIARSGWYVKQNSIKPELEKMVDEGEVCKVEVKEMTGPSLYMLSDYKKRKINLSGDAFILSPFDVLNVFRQRLNYFFDFDYMVECFVPQAKRKYGYFALPVLIGDTFVARMDSKADRKLGILVINNLHFESLKLTKPMVKKICDSIKAFAKFNQCVAVILKKSNRQALMKAIQKSLH